MHVAHIITRLILGGAQQNTLFNCEDQHRLHGDEVTLITGPGLGPEGSLVERAKSVGFRVIEIDALRRSLHPWRDWKSYREIIKTLKEISPDVVHTHSSKAGIMGRAAAAKLRIPAVHTVHGAAFHFGQSKLASAVYRFAERRAVKWCQAMICVCDALTDQYLNAGIGTREMYSTIYSGMDVEPFLNPPKTRTEVRDRLGFNEDDIVIAKVARLFDLKGHKYLIEAASEVVRKVPHVKFLFIGDGILRSEFEKRIAELNLSDSFLFAGLVPPEEIPELINASDIVAHTSVWEGLARVLPQGLIAAKPVVSYDIDGAREVVINNETGILLPSESVDELSQALIRLCESTELRDRMGTAGRDRFTDQFRHETMTERIREVYKRVLR